MDIVYKKKDMISYLKLDASGGKKGFTHSKHHLNYSNGNLNRFSENCFTRWSPWNLHYPVMAANTLPTCFNFVLLRNYVFYNRFNTYFKCHWVSIDQIQFVGEFSRNLHWWTFTAQVVFIRVFVAKEKNSEIKYNHICSTIQSEFLGN